MNQNTQQDPDVNVEPQKPESNTNSTPPPTNEEKLSLWEQAQKDLKALPPYARILLALVTVLLIFKLTPIVDILHMFFYIVCLPMLFLVGLGWLSKDTYMYLMGWLEAIPDWASKKHNEES
tara:strand:- start:482 stop:844 length:363 start_codon:yes stop_codon:yes gene_type:complete